jgi:hypothetical protein
LLQPRHHRQRRQRKRRWQVRRRRQGHGARQRPRHAARSGGSGGTGAGPNPDDKNCGLQTFKLQQRPAELMLVLDRSGSMNDPAGPMSTVSKWTDVTGALDETIMKTQSLVQWGLKSFPSSDMRCMVSDGVEVPSAAMNYARSGPASRRSRPASAPAAARPPPWPSRRRWPT